MEKKRRKNPSVVTLYVKNPHVWDESRERADSFDDSLSEYVEYALRFFNNGGGCSNCTCERCIGPKQ